MEFDSSKKMSDILRSSGTPVDASLPLWLQKDTGLVTNSLNLFGHILEDGDPRWGLAIQLQQLNETVTYRPIHMEVALGSVYLSKTPSFRNEYGRPIRPENLLQHSRAIANLSASPLIYGESDNIKLDHGYTIQLGRTNNITRKKDGIGITGCPEALHQIRILHNETYIVRAGFNVHTEDEVTVVSITNLQGVPNGCPAYDRFIDENGVPPFNYLVGYTKHMWEQTGLKVEFRGLKNPEKKEARPLYNTVFKKEGVPRYSFKRRDSNGQGIFIS